MAWTFPTLRQRRQHVRDYIVSHLPGSDATLAKSFLRVLADAQGGLAHALDTYHEWLSRQLFIHSADAEDIDDHNIWLTNGRKSATFASGNITLTGITGAVVPVATRLIAANSIEFETTSQITIGAGGTDVAVEALDAGIDGNLVTATKLSLVTAISGVDGEATVKTPGFTGGIDEENDEDFRTRIIQRIQEPPHAGDAQDYVAWAKEVAGVTRAWSYGSEMGVGTVTVRFMMDDVQSANGGFPQPGDVATVLAYIDVLRPVTVVDLFVVAPQPQSIDFTITNLTPDTTAIRASISAGVDQMLIDRATPGQTIYRSWVSEAISLAIGEDRHDLTFSNTAMTTANHMGILGTITYV